MYSCLVTQNCLEATLHDVAINANVHNVNQEIFLFIKFQISHFCVQMFSDTSQPYENLWRRKFMAPRIFHLT